MNKHLPLIVGASATVILAAGYFGLSAYSSKQAQKHLEDWVYEVSLDEKLSWRSVSASPFGGNVSIRDVELELGKNEPALRAAELIISERISDENQSRLRLQLKGIEADTAAINGLRGLGALASRNIDRELARASHNFEPALSSGLATLKPFDMELFVDVDDDAGTVEAEIAIALPELFDSRMSYSLSKQRDLNRKLKRLEDDLDGEDNPYRLIAKLQELAESIERAELANVRVSLQDRGMLERSIALYQRYNTPLDPTAGSADSQRSEHYAKMVERTVKNCQRESKDLPKSMDSSCDLLEDVLMEKVSGIVLSIEPTESVRLSDLAKLDNARQGKRVLERLNPELESL
ncbi:MAG: YdgA family protein [Gammaproteobacteria bacterium]|nr:YdgA family protein [Gammaproteobacteria bacterium]MBU2254677.1 YdgA family protein [Gammaproteobacteria bacterium]MBU2294547.1 YdgA family protein [Gammaproteobacteria bacterium]